MAEEAPDAGLAVADGAEIERAVGLAEAEVRVGTVVPAHFPGEGDDIGAVHAFALDDAEALLLVDLFRLRELPDAAGIGIGRDAVVRDAARHPHGALAAGALADEFHDPGLLRVADGEGFAGGAVAVFLHEVMHHLDGLPGRRAALQGQMHQGEIVQGALGAGQLVAAAPGGFHDGDLPFVHQAHDAVGVLRLGDVVDGGLGPPAADGDHLARRVLPGRGPVQRLEEAEAVAVVGADHASVGGSQLAHDEVRAGESGHRHEGQEGRQEQFLHVCLF